ncbi:hypothetical protein Tco_1088298 [Tanacetum coccineum]
MENGSYWLDKVQTSIWRDVRTLAIEEVYTTKYSIHPGADTMLCGFRLTNGWLSMKKDIASCGSQYLAYSKEEVDYQGFSGLLLQLELPESTRTRRAPDRMCLYIDAEEHELGDLSEPANYKAALLDPESDKWFNAMNVDMQSMKDNEVGELVDLPPNGKTVGHKWLFKKKTDVDGAVHTFKAHLNPGDAHWTAVKNILMYLRNTKDMFLVYGGDTKRELRVSCYTGAGYLTDADDMKSQTGYVFILNGGSADWKSTKQSIFATSSTNAEYIAAFDASKEAVWIRKFIFGLGVIPTTEEPINMYCDNTRAIAIVKDHGVTKGARHFCAKVHYLRETIEMGDAKIEKVDTDDNLADLFTKALAFPIHSELTEKIGMIPSISLM